MPEINPIAAGIFFTAMVLLWAGNGFLISPIFVLGAAFLFAFGWFAVLYISDWIRACRDQDKQHVN